MAEVYDVTRYQLQQWQDNNLTGFYYDSHGVEEEGARWLIVSAEHGNGTKFYIYASADMTAQTREEMCAMCDDYNATVLEEMTLTEGRFEYQLEYEVWHVVDAVPGEGSFTISGKELQEVASFADALVNLFHSEHGYWDRELMGDTGRYDLASEDHADGMLYIAQQIRDLVTDIAKRND